MAIAITILAAILICSLCIFRCRRYVKKSYTAIDTVLDYVIAGDSHVPYETESDSRLSKLTHKAVKAVQINNMSAAQLKQEKEIIQGFISDMSHQMKTPLSSICIYTDLLIEGDVSQEERQEFLLRTKECADKLQWMMDSLIKMSRLETGAIELAPALAGIKQTVSDSITVVLGAAAWRNMTVQTDVFEDIRLWHDRKWTAEAITNILENAVKYGYPGSTIRIGIDMLPTYTKLVVTNQGPGIAQDEWSSIYKRFYRGKNAQETSGAGLGLYLASLIMEKQGGYILVDSKPGQYASFSLFLQNCKK